MYYHYVRKPHSRRACMKNGDTQIVHLHHHISHYKVIGDTRSGTSSIKIHWRRAKLERVFDYKTHPRCTLMVHVTDLILGWGPYGTNGRRTQGRASPITQKSETCFILVRRRFNCRVIVALIGDVPY
jgi:hypothetical protein